MAFPKKKKTDKKDPKAKGGRAAFMEMIKKNKKGKKAK